MKRRNGLFDTYYGRLVIQNFTRMARGHICIQLQCPSCIKALTSLLDILHSVQTAHVFTELGCISRVLSKRIALPNTALRDYNNLFLLIVVFSIYVTPVLAQQVPDSISPGQIERQFEPIPIPRQNGGPIVPGQRQLVAPEGAVDIQFVLNDLVLEGVTVFHEAEIRSVFAPLIGKEITLLDLYRIANEVTTLYRNRGYILSQAIVPEQEVGDDGVVTIRVIEGYIDGLEINDADPKTKDKIEIYGNKILRSRPLHTKSLERYMLLMNDLGGVSAKATLAPSDAELGAAKLGIRVQRDDFDAYINPNNRSSDFYGPEQITANLSSHNIGNSLGTSSLFGASTLNQELNFLSLSHLHHFGGEGLTVSFDLSSSESEPGGALKELEIEQETFNAGLTVRYPIIRSRFKNLTMHGAFSIHDSESERLEVDDTGFNLVRAETEDNVRSIRAGLTYEIFDQVGGINQIIAEASKGLDAFGATEVGTTASRPFGIPDYLKFNFSAARIQSLNTSWSLLVAATAQISNDNLLSSEQFSVGGPIFGRGFDQSEILGDSGYAGQLELRYASNSNLSWLNEHMTYVFVDGGEIKRETPGDFEKDESLSSAGLGIRFRAKGNIRGYFELANPISHVVASQGNKDPRVFISIQFYM